MTDIFLVRDEEGMPRGVFSALAIAKNVVEKKLLSDISDGDYGQEFASRPPEVTWRERDGNWGCGFFRDFGQHGTALVWYELDIQSYDLDPEEI